MSASHPSSLSRRLQTVNKAIESLPEAERLVVRLHVHDELSLKAVSERTTLPYGEVRLDLTRFCGHLTKVRTVANNEALTQLVDAAK